MNLKGIIAKALQWIGVSPYHLLDNLYVPLDKKHVRRTRNIRLIPMENNRTGGKYSYAEWAHAIGIFQTLMFLHLLKKENNMILDVGCGTGLLAIASEPFLGKNGKYVGIDVSKKSIDFCRRHYPSAHFEFVHLDVANPAYLPAKHAIKLKWSVESESYDLVTALSVWTHLSEEDALFYFSEISRVLKPGGKAIVTFFLLDKTYQDGLGIRSHQEGRFHTTWQDRWIFDNPANGSNMWFLRRSAQGSVNAVGVNDAGLDRLTSSSGMKLIEYHQGNWKEVPGVYFQDVLIFQKA